MTNYSGHTYLLSVAAPLRKFVLSTLAEALGGVGGLAG